MKNILAICFVACFVVGCTADQWGQIENISGRTQGYSTNIGTIATKSIPVTGIYGGTLAEIALGLSTIAAGVTAFAKHKKAKKLEAK